MWSTALKHSGFNMYKLTITVKPSELVSFTVGKGLNQVSNDKLLTHFESERENAIWYHLSKSTSCHVVVFPKPTREQQAEVDKAIIDKFFEKSSVLKKNKDPCVMCCEFKNVKKTETLGLVKTCNARYIKQYA